MENTTADGTAENYMERLAGTEPSRAFASIAQELSTRIRFLLLVTETERKGRQRRTSRSA